MIATWKMFDCLNPHAKPTKCVRSRQLLGDVAYHHDPGFIFVRSLGLKSESPSRSLPVSSSDV
jgi:hypothetical protein